MLSELENILKAANINPEELVANIEKSNSSGYITFYDYPEKKRITGFARKEKGVAPQFRISQNKADLSENAELNTPLFEDKLGVEKIVKLQGFVVDMQLKFQHSYYNTSEPSLNKIHCSTIGYLDKKNNQYVKEYPHAPYPFLSSTQVEYDNSNRTFTNKAKSWLRDLDMLGSKGQRCVDCLAQGNNKTTEPSGDETYCSPSAELTFYLINLETTKTVKGKIETFSYSVKDLTDGESEGIFVTVPLSPKAGLKGIISLKKDKSKSDEVRAWHPYVQHLNVKYNFNYLETELDSYESELDPSELKTLASPYLHYTEIAIRTAQSVTNQDRELSCHFLEFTSLKSVISLIRSEDSNLQLYVEANKLWQNKLKEINPEDPQILDIKDFVSNEIAVGNSNGNSNGNDNLKTIATEYITEEDGFSEDEDLNYF